MTDEKNLVVRPKAELGNPMTVRRGFEDEQTGDVIMPRAKILQAADPILADDNLRELNLRPGDIINSLTNEKINTTFIPIFKFSSRILWIPRDLGGGMACRSHDFRNGEVLDAARFGYYNSDSKQIKPIEGVVNGQICSCDDCPLGSWEGDIPPVCTASMNFLSIFEEAAFPVVISFTNTGYKYGRKLYSMAKLMPGDMFAFKYKLTPVRKSNEKGTFFVPEIYPAGAVTQEELKMAESFFNTLKGATIKFHEEEEMGDPNQIQNSVTNEM